MCKICEDLNESIRIEQPYQYFNIVEQIKKKLFDEALVLIESNCSFSDIGIGKPFPVDVPYHVFECNNCKQKFSLSVETYHGSGGSWTPVE